MKSENKIFINTPRSLEVILITIFILILFAISILFVLRGDLHPLVKFLICAAMIISSLWCACLTPRHISVDKDNLVIKKVCGNTSIPLSDIVDIDSVNSKLVSGSIRTFGSGGFFGYLGKFYNSDIGGFLMYATERKNLILIITKKKKIMVNCTDPDKVISFVNTMKNS